ncbi:MAG: efflux RND transporter periplasmic adaptor subunit [Bryobacterales bacterium]|nr:efflux RND transporter periplasmic adaptor subunit [Bryobacterales bacterium]
MRKILIRVIILAVAGVAIWQGYRLYRQMPQRQREIATTKVRRGDVLVRSFARGELRAVRSATLTAPNLFGTVQVTRLAALGSLAREKDLVVEFDDAEVRSRLEEKQLELDQIDEQIKKAEADLAIRTNQDDVELLRTRYSVRRADLEVRRNELISKIDAKKNVLSQEEARRRLKQLESDVKSRREQAEAQIDVLREQKNKSTLELERERARLSQVKLLAPMAGLVSIRQNIAGQFRMFGMQLPDIREGDQVQPGMPIADVLDLSELEVVAKVGELDRANLREGQDVVIELDAIPNQRFKGKIKTMSGTASANLFSADPAKKFDVAFGIDMKQLLSSLGAKPDQVRRVMEQAEQNRRKPPQASNSVMDTGVASALLGNQQTTRPGGTETPAAAAAPSRGASGSRRRGATPFGDLSKMFAALRPYSDKELAEAKLPLPPEEDSGLDVLLRPGLLADVEIIVEKIPSAIHIPNQAVFEHDGKPIVYVKSHGRFEERPIRIFKRSESVTVVTGGLEENELVALANPTEKKGESKSGNSSGGGSMGGFSGGKK